MAHIAYPDSPATDSDFRNYGERPDRAATKSSAAGDSAVCYTRHRPAGYELCGIPIALVGAGVVTFGIYRLFVQNVAAGGIALGLSGGFVLALGLFLSLNSVFRGQHAIEANAEGLEYVDKHGTRNLAWQDIHKVLTQDFFPHGNSDLVLNVTVEPRQGRPIRFDTTYDGEPWDVIQALLTHCDYIVRNPQGYVKRTA